MSYNSKEEQRVLQEEQKSKQSICGMGRQRDKFIIRWRTKKLGIYSFTNTAYDEDEVSDCELNDKPSYEELHNTFYELNEECLILSRKCSKQKN